jgi:XTP/dITP diphosphohydrolase
VSGSPPTAIEIVLGTTNAGKLRECTELLAPFGIVCRSLAGLTGAVEVDETGTTFAENAALKATAQARALGRWVIAEDSGLVVSALDGAPGVNSARFSGPAPADDRDAVDARNNALLLERLAGRSAADRACHYACHAALADPRGVVVATASGTCHGVIAEQPRGGGGFGYDPLFVVPEYGRTFGEIPPAVKAVISHRARALRALLPAVVRLLAACVVMAYGLAPLGARAEPTAGAADVVATIDTVPILRGELEAVLRRLASTGGPTANEAQAGSGPDEGPPLLAAAALEQLVDERLLRGEIDRVGVGASDAEISARLDLLRQQVAARGLGWEDFLARNGRDDETVRGQVALEIGVAKLVQPKVTGSALDNAFQARRRELDGTRLRVSHVLLRPDLALGDEAVERTLEHAASIRREVLQGVLSFADAARRHSVAPSRARGGDVGWITRQGPLGDPFAKQVYALAKGDVSRPFVTPFGVHLAQVTDIEPGTLDREAIRPTLEQILMAEAIRGTISRLRAETAIDYAAGVPHFDPATPADAGQPRRVVVAAEAERAASAQPPAAP